MVFSNISKLKIRFFRVIFRLATSMKKLFPRIALLGGLLLLNPLAEPAVRADSIVLDSNTPQAKSARGAFAAALPLIMGTTLHPVDSQELFPLVKRFISPKYGGAAKYKEGLKFSDAAEFLKWRLKNENIERTGLVYRVYRDTFGRNPTDADLKYWLPRVQNEGKWWFFTLVPVNVKWMNESDANEKKAAISRSYRAAFGREATAAELADKLKGDGHFRKLREAHRAFLWSDSPAANAELRETLHRLLKSQPKPGIVTPLSDAAFKFLKTLYSANGRKPTFQEINHFEVTKNWPAQGELIPVG